MAAMEHAVASYLSEPTYCRLKHKIKPSLSAKLDHLQNVITAFLSSQQQQEKMMSEAKLLHIMIYKRNRQLRSEKSLQLLKRVQACLKRASTFGRLFTLTGDVHKDLHSAAVEKKGSETVYLPAQQTWSYLLYLQLQYAKLLDTNASFCIIAFKHLSCQLSSGMLIPQMIVFMAIVARIWLLSRSITEKMQSCYNTICSLRQHIQRTNSDWIDPVLPLELQLDDTIDANADLQAKMLKVGQVSAAESRETIQKEQCNITVQKNVFSSLDEEGEDIGVPVAMKRPVAVDSFGSTKIKGEKTGASEINNTKQRKRNGPVKHDTVKEISDEIISDFTTLDMPAKKMKKRQLEGLDNNEIKPKKIKRSIADNVTTLAEVQSLKTNKKHDMDSCYSDELPNAATYKRSKKHKKKEEMKLSSRQIASDNVDKNSKKLKKKRKLIEKKEHKIKKCETKSNRLEVKPTKAIIKIKKKKFVTP